MGGHGCRSKLGWLLIAVALGGCEAARPAPPPDGRAFFLGKLSQGLRDGADFRGAAEVFHPPGVEGLLLREPFELRELAADLVRIGDVWYLHFARLKGTNLTTAVSANDDLANSMPLQMV